MGRKPKEIVNGKKICTKCGINKPVSEYHKSGPSRLRSDCKPCRNAFKRSQKYGLSNYGIDKADYVRMKKEQNDACKICGAVYPVLCVDHCHTGGQVRGLLCGHCNKGLGFFKDNIENLNKAIEYLREDEQRSEISEDRSNSGEEA